MNSVEEVRERLAAATPGPWAWRGNLDTHNIHLRCIAPESHYPDVLRFHRSGMQGGKPVFNRPGDRLLIDVNTDRLAVFQVCPTCTDPKDGRLYRRDIVGIRHPDAELIAKAPEDIAFLLRRIDALEGQLASLREEQAGMLAVLVP